MTLDFWLEPMWLMWPTLILLALAVAFALSVWMWARAIEPVPLNYLAEPRYHRPITRSTNLQQIYAGPVMMATASSAIGLVPYPGPQRGWAWMDEQGYRP